MPKKLKLHPNERIDLGDFQWGTAGYPDAVQEEQNKILVTGRRAQTLSGFRILIDPTIAGSITVYDGSYLDINGKLVTNSETDNHSEGITLVGSNLTFYVEIEFVESDIDIDNRAIWDSTYDNGVGKPKGREFYDDVTTRTSTIWRIVTPVSTTGFAATFDPTSPKLPLAILKTDTTGKISFGVNPGLSTGPFSTVLEETSPVGTTFFRVLDASNLPEATKNVTIGSQTKVIASIDHQAGTFTTTTPASVTAPAGTIVAGDPARSFMRQRTAAQIEFTGAASTHPDKLRRLFSGNESRGSVVLASKTVSQGRDDTSIQTLRDYVDVLSAQIREIKIGSTAPFYSGTLPNARYYDYLGSLQGVRAATYTIGNGTTTFGDFNGTTEAPFAAAISLAVSQGLTAVVLFVKKGIYTWNSSVNATSTPVNVVLIGSNSIVNNEVTVVGGDITTPMFNISGSLRLENIAVTGSTSPSSMLYTSTMFGQLELLRCAVYLNNSSLVQSQILTRVTIRDGSVTTANINTIIAPSVISVIDNSQIVLMAGAGNVNFVTTWGTSDASATLNWSSSAFYIASPLGQFAATINVVDSYVRGCKFSLTATNSCGKVITTTNANNVNFAANFVDCASADNNAYMLRMDNMSNCRFTSNVFRLGSPSKNNVYVILASPDGAGNHTDVVIEGNEFSLTPQAGAYGACFITSAIGRLVIANNRFTGGFEAAHVSLLTGSGSIVFTGNSCFQQSSNVLSTDVFTPGVKHLESLTFANNQCRSLQGGGLHLVLPFTDVVIANNTFEQDSAAAGPINISAIYVTGPDRVAITGNSIDGTVAAVTGSSIARASVFLEGCTLATVTGNHLVWNPQGGGTNLQANLRIVDVYCCNGSGNIIRGRNVTAENCRAVTIVKNVASFIPIASILSNSILTLNGSNYASEQFGIVGAAQYVGDLNANGFTPIQ